MSGNKITGEIHDKLKKCIESYIEEEQNIVRAAMKQIEGNSLRIREMAKIIYHKGWDAEILEKHIGFLKKLFE